MKKLSQKTVKNLYRKLVVITVILGTTVIPAFAADDPLGAINNLSTFVFAAIRAVGVILLGWGVVQIGMSIQSHDASQRTQGFLCFFGGLMIAFAKAILDIVLA